MQVGQQAGVAQHVGRWNKSRPAGVSKVDLTTVWGQAQTPLATSGDHLPLALPGESPSVRTVPHCPVIDWLAVT